MEPRELVHSYLNGEILLSEMTPEQIEIMKEAREMSDEQIKEEIRLTDEYYATGRHLGGERPGFEE